MASTPPIFNVRRFLPADAPAVDDLLQQGFGGFEEHFPGAAEALAMGATRLAQTGHDILVATDEAGLAGVVRFREVDGIGWFDLLVSGAPGAGRALVRAVERNAQDLGVRLLRVQTPDDPVLDGYFHRLGYLPVWRDVGSRQVVYERRLPLLTVREQRRSDAADIGRLTGEDPWQFEQGLRPGWFVLADGERVVGVIAVREARPGVAAAREPVVQAGYEGRALEVWMLERVAQYAETNGFYTISAPHTPALKKYERELEERRWFPEGELFVKQL
jgi:predicted N-acetyltransferase YhbS/GNAT superfamily N-acetyltransferase